MLNFSAIQNYSFVESFSVSKNDSFIFWCAFTFPSTFTFASRNNRPSFCMLPHDPGYRLLTNAHHTSYGSLHIVRMLLKGKNASTFPKCDIGHPVSQKNNLTATSLQFEKNNFHPNIILCNSQTFVTS